ncbi:unnamed protein product [Linum trigynum]|uniref:Uncharacterized protein n=1 Tax=Linum trigynum TaxID=586398 RepID=A0AAV2FD19_9ROSI
MLQVSWSRTQGEPMLSLVIDGESCMNVVSFDVVKKLGLRTSKHPEPYTLHWFNYYSEIKVNKQAKIKFAIGRYEDEIQLDVALMQTSHLLLG